MAKQHKGPKVLFVDIETRPMLGFIWALWDQNVGLNQIKEGEDIETIAWSAKWAHDDTLHYSDKRNGKSVKSFLKAIWGLLDEADIVVWHNGDKFDFKHLNTAFVLADMGLPSPYRKIDTLKVVKRYFAFPSYKLEYVAKRFKCKNLKSGHKKFPGMELWIQCLSNNQLAWKEMEHYNKQDVRVLEEVYYKLLPYDTSINFSVYNDGQHMCSCGSTELRNKGTTVTNSGVYKRFKCKKCGKHFQDKVNDLTPEQRKSIKKPLKY